MITAHTAQQLTNMYKLGPRDMLDKCYRFIFDACKNRTSNVWLVCKEESEDYNVAVDTLRDQGFVVIRENNRLKISWKKQYSIEDN